MIMFQMFLYLIMKKLFMVIFRKLYRNQGCLFLNF
nr:MAG TPA: hypothetical protein [Caudoviricetes sp.]